MDLPLLAGCQAKAPCPCGCADTVRGRQRGEMEKATTKASLHQ